MRLRFRLLILGVLTSFACAPRMVERPTPPMSQGPVTVTTLPETPLVAPGRIGRELNFDLIVRNESAVQVELVTMRAAIRDASGGIVMRLELNDNGVAPGIHVMGERAIAAGATRMFFNPFHTVASEVPVDVLEYELVFRDPSKSETVTRLRVAPRAFEQRTHLRLPLEGPVLVWDGHDYYSHHRRFDVTHPMIASTGIQRNAGRYSLDLVKVDGDGLFQTPGGTGPESYPGYRSRVVAPGAGVVVRSFDGVADDHVLQLEDIQKDPTSLLGNYVIIDHGNGEFSQLAHLNHKSVKVQVGDRVEVGQVLAAVGNSGSSLFPHLHYQLVSGADLNSEGLPAQFDGFHRILGSRRLDVARGVIDSGDLIETAPAANPRN